MGKYNNNNKTKHQQRLVQLFSLFLLQQKKCDQCEFTAKGSHGLETHQRSTHGQSPNGTVNNNDEMATGNNGVDGALDHNKRNSPIMWVFNLNPYCVSLNKNTQSK